MPPSGGCTAPTQIVPIRLLCALMGYPLKNEVGNRHGRLTVLDRHFVDDPETVRTWWRCRCDCGKETFAIGTDLRSGRKASCGCAGGYNAIEETGNRHGRLTVLERQRHFRGEQKDARWVCLCDCGLETVVTGYNLRGGRVRSCGCLGTESKFGSAYQHSKKPGFGIGPSAYSKEARG
jgi:hypothetical protein